MKQEMLINVAQPEECRIAIVEDGVLEELYVERTSQDNYVGNIYKGRIVNLEPSIQAAFVDFGVGRNGFLHISDVEPQYFRQGGYDPQAADQCPTARSRDERFEPAHDDGERRTAAAADAATAAAAGTGGRSRRAATRRAAADQAADSRHLPARRRSARAGHQGRHRHQGPTLSTYISIPGRYLVLMPALGRIGVSRKIESDEDRRRLRDILRELNPPKGVGFIVRTAGTDRTKKELSRDLAYLLRLWKVIVRRIKKTPGAGRHLRRKRHDHPHDPRHLHRRRRRDLHRRAGGVRAGQGVFADRHAAVRQPAASSTKARSRCSTSTSSTRRSPGSTSARCRSAAAGRS